MNWRRMLASWGTACGVGIGLMSAGGCFGTAAEVGLAPSEPRLRELEVDQQLGQRVRVVGEAQNTPLGATVVDDDFVVYLQEFRAWPAPIVGRRVEAVGVASRSGRVAGDVGEQAVVLRQASYLLME